MRYTIASLALAALATAKPMPGGVTSAVAPSGSAPAGCQTSYSGSFEIEVVNASSSSKRSIAKRDITLVMTLQDGILTDSDGRTGYIASNYQFQFDKPPQAGAIYTAGWSICSNGSLTLGDDSVFYQCLSGMFYNLYDKDWAAQCSPIYIQVIGTSGTATTAAASQISDGQITASPQPICEYTDGQPQATNCVSQISDGQVQAHTTTSAVCEYIDGQPQAGCSTSSAVCEYIDGQPQAGCSSTSMPMTTTSAVCEYVDGQPQAGCSTTPMTTSSAVCEYSDGQPQEGCSSTVMSMTTTSAVCEYVDGQPQAGCSTTMTTSTPMTSIANATVTTPTSSSVVPYTGAAMPTALRGEIFGLAAGVLAVAML